MDASIIVAMTPDRVIGWRGRLPWHQSADLRRFKQLTMGHHIILGRRTYDSIGRLLPGRHSVVVSRRSDLDIPGAQIAASVPQALQLCGDDPEVYIVGGAEIYCAALPITTRLYLTIIHATLPGDVFFPELTADQWQLVSQEQHPADDRNQYDYTFQVLDRVPETTRTRRLPQHG